MKKLRYLFTIIFSLTISVSFAQTITWTGGTGGTGTQWSNPDNWNLTIIPTASTDVVIPISANIDLGTLDITINSLRIEDINTVVEFTNSGTLNFSINELFVENNTVLRCIQTSNMINFEINTKADIHGTIELNEGNKIQYQGTETNKIIFYDNSIFIAGDYINNEPFGNVMNYSVLFMNGSTYEHHGGNTPFGSTDGSVTVTTFEPNSNYEIYDISSIAFSVDSRTYGNIINKASNEITFSNTGSVGPLSFSKLINDGEKITLETNKSINITGEGLFANTANIALKSNNIKFTANEAVVAGSQFVELISDFNTGTAEYELIPFDTKLTLMTNLIIKNGGNANYSTVCNGTLDFTNKKITLGSNVNLKFGDNATFITSNINGVAGSIGNIFARVIFSNNNTLKFNNTSEAQSTGFKPSEVFTAKKIIVETPSLNLNTDLIADEIYIEDTDIFDLINSELTIKNITGTGNLKSNSPSAILNVNGYNPFEIKFIGNAEFSSINTLAGSSCKPLIKADKIDVYDIYTQGGELSFQHNTAGSELEINVESLNVGDGEIFLDETNTIVSNSTMIENGYLNIGNGRLELHGTYNDNLGGGTLIGGNDARLEINDLILTLPELTLSELTILGGSNPNIGMDENLTINNQLNLESGALSINSSLLTINGEINYINGVLIGSNLSQIEINSSSLVNLKFDDTSNTLSQLTLGSDATLLSDLIIKDNLLLNTGNLNLGNGFLTILENGITYGTGALSGAANASLKIVTDATPIGIKFDASNILQSLIVENLQGSEVNLQSDLTITTNLTCEAGKFEINSNKLTINGQIDYYNDGILAGIGGSEMKINSGSTVSLEFDDTENILNTLTLQSDVSLMSNLKIRNLLNLESGKLFIESTELTIGGNIINAGGTLAGNENSILTIDNNETNPTNLQFDNINNSLNTLNLSGTTQEVYLLSDLEIYTYLNLSSGRLKIIDNDLSLLNNCNVVANENNYIIAEDNGYVTKTLNFGDINKIIPIGTTNYYTPVYVDNLETTGDLEVQAKVFEGVYSSGIYDGNPLNTNKIVNQTYEIVKSGDANIKFAWSNGLEGVSYNIAQSTIANYVTDQWLDAPSGDVEDAETGIENSQKWNNCPDGLFIIHSRTTTPTVTNNTVNIDATINYVFSVDVFNYDGEDNLQKIKITETVANGVLFIDFNNNNSIETEEEIISEDEIYFEELNNGKLKFSPSSGTAFNNTTSFKFKASDGFMYSNEATLTLQEINHAPIASNQTVDISATLQNSEIVALIDASDSDAGQTLSYSIDDATQTFDINNNGEITLINNTNLLSMSNIVVDVTIIDDGTPSMATTIQVTFNIIQENIAPQADEEQVFSINEKMPNETIIGKINIIEPDPEKTLIFSVDDYNVDALYINEQTGDISVKDSELLIFAINPTIEYNVNVSYDGIDASTTVKVIVNLQKLPETNVVISNYISPNGDGHNDNWIIQNNENLNDYDVLIYDNRGRVIFKSLGYNNQWDGTYGGTKLDEGVYYYVITSGEKKLIGVITLNY